MLFRSRDRISCTAHRWREPWRRRTFRTVSSADGDKSPWKSGDKSPHSKISAPRVAPKAEHHCTFVPSDARRSENWDDDFCFWFGTKSSFRNPRRVGDRRSAWRFFSASLIACAARGAAENFGRAMKWLPIQFGIETEVGIARDGEDDLDVVMESIALVRSVKHPGIQIGRAHV